MFDLHIFLKKIMIEPHSLYFWLIEISVLFLGWLLILPFGFIIKALTAVLGERGLIPIASIIGYSIGYFSLSLVHLHYTGQHFSFALLAAMIGKELLFDSKDEKLSEGGREDTYANAFALIICLIAIAIKGPFAWY